MALTSLTSILFAFLLLEDQLWSCAGDLWARFIHRVLKGFVSSGKTENTEGVKYRREKALDVKLRNAVTLEQCLQRGEGEVTWQAKSKMNGS